MEFLAGFALGFASSLLASFSFWYFTVRVPRKRDERNIREHGSIVIRGVIGQGKIVFQTLLREAEISRDFQDITPDDIRLMGPRLKLKKDAPSIPGFLILRGLTFAQYLCFYKARTVSDVEHLFTYIYFLDSDLVRILNRIIHSRYFILCDEWLKNVALVSDPDLTSFDIELFEYYSAIKELERYAIKKGLLAK
jgi:hypothetical protein